jgi:hypothetical protein
MDASRISSSPQNLTHLRHGDRVEAPEKVNFDRPGASAPRMRQDAAWPLPDDETCQALDAVWSHLRGLRVCPYLVLWTVRVPPAASGSFLSLWA